MERLNEIMNRTATKRRQQVQEQRPTQAAQPGVPSQSPQGLRPGQSLARRSPLPEQTARQGQQNSPVAPQPPPSQVLNRRPQAQHPIPPGTGNRGEQQGTRYLQQRSYDQTLRQNDAGATRRSVYRQHPQQSSIHDPQRPLSRQDMRSSGYEAPEERVLSKETGDYYDAYPAMPPADVQEEWEDDAASMRYGDWEEAEEHDMPRYSRSDVEEHYAAAQDVHWPTSRIAPRPQVNSPLYTRELPTMASGREAEIRSSMSRNVREAHIIQAPPPTPPAPLAPAHEAQRYLRNTQPLNPRAIAGMNQHMPHERLHSNLQPARQVEVYEAGRQGQQHLPALMAPLKTSKSVCPKCKGAGYLRADVPYGHPNFGKPIACECKEAEKKEKRRQQLLELSDLSAFHNQSFRNFRTSFSGAHPSIQEAFQEAYKFAQNPNGWLVLIGPNGSGKTHLAAAIANQNLSDGAVVLFTVVPDLLAHLRATFAPTSTEAYDQRFSKMREAELLVLDDLGSHQSSPWANEKLFQLLNYRYNSGYPTVITANKQGLTGLDERILSRISDTSLVTTVVMNGAVDYRRQNPRREPLR